MHRARRHFRNDPDGTRLPVKLDTATNGELRRFRSPPCIGSCRASRCTR